MDEVERYKDGSKLSCILAENKADLLKGKYVERDPGLEKFGKKHGFCGSFRTSAKTGLNIYKPSESNFSARENDSPEYAKISSNLFLSTVHVTSFIWLMQFSNNNSLISFLYKNKGLLLYLNCLNINS